MSEPTRDPIEALENFGTGGIAVNPLEPDQVRRLGDKRRRRQNTMYGAIAAVVVAVAIIPTAVLVTKDDGATPRPPANSTPPDPSPSTIPEPTPTVITFPGVNGVEVKTASDVDKLTGTSEEFKAFIAATLQQAIEDGASCSDAYHGVHVQKYVGTGFAVGGVNSCGGYTALWTIQNGTWKEALGTQEEWFCGDLSRFSVPDGFAGECYGPKELFGPDDDYGLRLGMTMDQVRAAGGTVSAPASDGTDFCRTVKPKGVDLEDADGNPQFFGYLSLEPNRGVVALYAQKYQVTPRGIRTGSTVAELKAAYPEATRGGFGSYFARINATSSYRFDLEQDDTVGTISLELDGQQGCYE